VGEGESRALYQVQTYARKGSVMTGKAGQGGGKMLTEGTEEDGREEEGGEEGTERAGQKSERVQEAEEADRPEVV